MELQTVLVTGFGPFAGFKVNPSWEAVKLLPVFNKGEVELIVEEIPVAYKDVDEKVKMLWDKHKPTLVVHVGVAGSPHAITFETKANRSGYSGKDCFGQNHPSGNCCAINEGSETLSCEIDATEICNVLKDKYSNVSLRTSENAGRYLCEYIFYTSLRIDCKRTMFVHVPPLDQPFSAGELAEFLWETVKCALKQLNCNCNVTKSRDSIETDH